MRRDTFGLVVMAILIVAALGVVYTSTDDPATAWQEPTAWWNHAWVGAVAVGLAAPLIWRTMAGPRGGYAVALGVIFLGAVAYYMFGVRGW